jgi:hypothetical protein
MRKRHCVGMLQDDRRKQDHYDIYKRLKFGSAMGMVRCYGLFGVMIDRNDDKCYYSLGVCYYLTSMSAFSYCFPLRLSSPLPPAAFHLRLCPLSPSYKINHSHYSPRCSRLSNPSRIGLGARQKADLPRYCILTRG